MSRTLALTGASGFVGRQVLRHLLAADCKVRLILRRGSLSRLNVPPQGLDVVETDDLFAESVENLERWTQGIDTLVHAAWYAEPGKYLDSTANCECLSGTLRLAQAFAQSGGRRFVGVGTCFEYDLDAGTLGVDTPLKPSTLYAATKVAAFQVLSQLLPAAKVQFAWCRLFYLHGEGEDERRLVPYLRRRLAAGESADLTTGNQVRDFMDVADAGRRLVAVALGDRVGPINICSGVATTVRQLAERIADDYGARELLHFGARPDNRVDPPLVVGIPNDR